MAFETAIIITVDNRGANKRIAETRAEFANLASTVRRGMTGMNSEIAELATPLERAQGRVAELRLAFAGMRSDTVGVADALRNAQGQAVSLARVFSGIGSGAGGGGGSGDQLRAMIDDLSKAARLARSTGSALGDLAAVSDKSNQSMRGMGKGAAAAVGRLGAMARAVRGVSIALGAAGGLLGLIALVATTFLLFSRNSSAAQTSIARAKEEISRLTDEINRLDDAAQRARGATPRNRAADDLRDNIGDLEGKIAKIRDSKLARLPLGDSLLGRAVSEITANSKIALAFKVGNLADLTQQLAKAKTTLDGLEITQKRLEKKRAERDKDAKDRAAKASIGRAAELAKQNKADFNKQVNRRREAATRLAQAGRIGQQAIEDERLTIKAENIVLASNVKLTKEAFKEKVKEVSGILDLEAANKKATDARQLAADAAQEAAKKEMDARRERAEALQRPFDEASRAIVSTFKDTFADILRTGEFSFKDLAGSIKGIFINLASEIARLLIFQPVVGGILSGIGLGGTAGALGLGAAGASLVGGSSSGGISALQSASLAGQAGNLFGIDLGIGNAINQFGVSLGFGQALTPVASVGTEVASGGVISGGLTSASLSSVLGAAGIGGLAGGLLGPLVGLNGTGSSVGGALGAGLGSILGGAGAIAIPVVGGIVGTVLGGLIGGLFGGQPSVGPNSGARISGDPLRIISSGADNGGNAPAARELAEAAILALNRTAEALGATINPKPKTLAVGFDPSGARAGIRVRSGTFDFFSKGKEPDEVIRDLVLHQLKLPDFFQGVGDAARTAIAHSAATSLDDLLSDIDFATGIERAVEGLADAAQELDRIQIAARQASEAQLPAILEFLGRAKGLGLTDQAGQALDKAIDNLIDFTENDQAITESEKALAAPARTNLRLVTCEGLEIPPQAEKPTVTWSLAA